MCEVKVRGCNLCLPVMSGTYVNEPVLFYLDHGKVRVESSWTVVCGGGKIYKNDWRGGRKKEKNGWDV